MTPSEAAEAAISADRAHGDAAIWITRRSDEDIRAAARSLDLAGPAGKPLWGRSFAVKDNIDVAGMPTTAGCPGYAYLPAEDAPVARALLDAGALLVGKTNLDQFATGLVGTRSPYGVPRNVFDAARVPGGSSSGSGVAVAAGIVDFALGTDTAGSGRVPAAFGGIIGLKPTLGSLSTRGMVPACCSIDTISVFARTVDATLDVARVAAGYDAADPYSPRAPHAHLRRGGDASCRVAIADVAADCEPEVTRLYARAAGLFDTRPVDIAPFLEIARLLYDGPWVAERTASLRGVIRDRPEILHPVTRAILQGGLERRAVDAFDAFHALARARRVADELFTGVDALLLPTVPYCPTLAELVADSVGPNSRLGRYTNFVNLCDLAAIAVPAGIGADGLPVGVTLIGPAWSEGRLASLADRVHRAFAPGLSPAAAPDTFAPDETALFCIGAHMAGLPLNRQVTGLGGRFLREARTRPEYRLHALGNRPGMVRGGDGAIAGEVWALPTAAIGALLAQVPPPLGFGTVALEDGPCLGFLAEGAGVEGAEDITAFGGWRAWIAAN